MYMTIRIFGPQLTALTAAAGFIALAHILANEIKNNWSLGVNNSLDWTASCGLMMP
jgi:hypothetical protein